MLSQPLSYALLGLLGTALVVLWLRHRSFSQLKPTLEKLKSSEERLRTIIESAHDAFIAIDSEGIVINWNKQAEKIFGWKEHQAVGQILANLIIPERYRLAHSMGMKRFMTTGQGPVINKRIELSALHQAGHEFPIEMTIYPFHHGDTYYFGSFIQDISSRKQSEAVQKSQFEITEILSEHTSLKEAAPKLISAVCTHLGWAAGELWLYDDKTKKIKCHHFWSNLHDRAHVLKEHNDHVTFSIGEGLPGRVWESGTPAWIEDIKLDQNFPRSAAALESNFHRAVAFPITTDEEVVGVMGFYSVVPGKADPSLMQLMTDIGKRIGAFIQRRLAEERLAGVLVELEKRVEERTQQLEETNHRLANANRLKDEFLATVSHELRTPLNVIQGHSELLLARNTFEADVQNSLQAIHRNSKSQGVIINDILDVSRIITGKLKLTPGAVDLREVIQRSVEAVAIAAQAKNITIKDDIAIQTHTTVLADYDRIQQVLWNLLTNAVKFTPANGKVTISLRDFESKVEISVRDTGIGIEPSFLPYVFERFRQEDASTTRAHGGLGLGMAIARHIVELHGGTIEVHSEGKDRGAEFKICLPILDPTQLSDCSVTQIKMENKSAATNMGALKGARILLVDDEADTLTLTRMILISAGAVVTVASSVDEALDKVGDQSHDIIVTDIGMAGRDGYDLIKECPGIPAVALTAYAAESDRQKALAAGFKKHLVKPIESGELVLAIKDVLGLV